MPLFDIVIPTYNNLAELKLCLGGFQTQTVRDFKIFVCVDGVTDGTPEYLKSSLPYDFSITVLEHTDYKNHGRAAARNLALPKLSAQYLVFLDSDLRVREDFLELHLSLLENDDIISVGDIVYEEGGIWRDYILSRGKHQFQKHKSEVPFKYFETGNVALPTHVFLELNGFDENFSGYGGEDTELACRIWEKFRLKTLYNKQATAFGKMEKDLNAALSQREVFAGSGLRYIQQKHPDLPEIFNLDFLDSSSAKFLYNLVPESKVLSVVNSQLMPKSLRLKMVHLLVFCYMYRGYHQKR